MNPDGQVKVSVVVPVFNPGPAIEPCIASLLGQSLPAGEVEILFVDDGSTDGSGARLDAVAAEAPNVRVIHIPPSGAPGRPRNVGLAEARGEYVHFVDADDILAPRALEWLTRFADEHGSDVVMGKYASASLRRSQVVFTHSHARASLTSTPDLLTASWAPAKLFRTALLREHRITFPEGWRWLEDQVFLLRAYLAARNISIFADAPCYFFVRREEGGHLSAEAQSPEPHVAHLGEAFDVIEAGTPPGPLRDQLLRRFYRANVLSRLDDRFLAADAALRDRTFSAFHRFATTRVDPSVDATFSGVNRVRARLLRAGNAEGLVALIEYVEAHDLTATVTSLRWHDRRLTADVQGELRHRETGAPMRFLLRDGRTWMDPDVVRFGDELVEMRIGPMTGRVSLVDPETALEWLVPARFVPVPVELEDHRSGGRLASVAVHSTVEVDPLRIGPAGIPLADGAWSVGLRWNTGGLNRSAPLRREGSETPDGILPAAFGDPPRLAVPRLGEDGLSLDVRSSGLDMADWHGSLTTFERQGRSLEVALPIVAGSEAGTSTAEVALRGPAQDVAWSAEVRPWLGGMGLRTTSGPRGTLPATAALGSLSAWLGAPYSLDVVIGAARLEGASGLRVVGFVDSGTAARLRRRVAWQARAALGELRSRLHDAATGIMVRLPSPLRRVGVAGVRSLQRVLGPR